MQDLIPTLAGVYWVDINLILLLVYTNWTNVQLLYM